MTFAAGLAAGIIITALGGLFVFQARVIEGGGRARRPDLRNLIAVTALVIAVIALIRSGDHGAASPSTVTVPVSESPTSLPASPTSAPESTSVSSSSASSTTVLHQVTVPNVVGMTQTAAIAALQRAGLRSRVQLLDLPKVPGGFVVTQTPQAYSTTTSGAMAVLGVSTGA